MIVLTLACCVAATAAQNNYEFKDSAVADLFRYARMAIGGGAVDKLKTLRLTGHSKVEVNGILVDCAVDIKLLLPNYYLRRDATPTSEKLAGLAGDGVLNAIWERGTLTTPPTKLTSTIRDNERARLGRFLLGTMTYVTPNLPMSFSSTGLIRGVGNAEPNVADAIGLDGIHIRVEMDVTRMPVRLIYGRDREEIMTFAERRKVGGLKLPFHITTTAGGRVTDELVFDEISVNPQIGKADFTNR